ncbi:hypothetical protein C8J57DRAFT_1291060, partial [Mycena rebaudengoi]
RRHRRPRLRPPPPPPPPRRLITDVSSFAHAVTPSASPVEPPPLPAVSSVSTSSSSSKRRYSDFASESPPEEPTSATTRDPRRRRSEHAPPSARSSRERLSDCESPKKPPRACLFCRGRKIACGPPVGGSIESVGSCNQCQRRAIKCEYSAESRRGMRKKKGVVVGPSTTLLAGVGESSSTIIAAASLGAGGRDVKPGIKTESSVGSIDRMPTPPSASSSLSSSLGMKVATIKTEADVEMPSLPSSSSSAPMSSLQ